MKWLSIIFIIILCLLLISLFLKVKIIIDFRHNNDDDRLNITIQSLFGLLKYKKEVPMIKVSDDSPAIITNEKTETGPKGNEKDEDKKEYTVDDLIKNIEQMKAFIHQIFGLTTIMKKFLKKVTINHLHWTTTIGLGDAAHTGVIVGAIWAVKGNMIGLISNFMRLADFPHLSVVPVFNQKKTETSFYCIFSFRIGHAIFVGIKIAKYWVGSSKTSRRQNYAKVASNKTNSA